MAVNADLIDAGGTTIDTDTGLEWLDMTLTAGTSYNDVIGGFGGYVSTMGYRYATAAEVFTLFSNAGIPDIETVNVSFTAANVVPAQALIALIGAPNGVFMTAIVADVFAAGFHYTATIQGFPDFATATTMSVCTMCGFWGDSAGTPGTGSFLVRAATVPEPGTLALLGLGLAGIGLTRRRKKV